LEDVIMRTITPAVSGLALACSLALCGGAQAQTGNDAGNDAGHQAALKTLQKEIGAAYEEARRACAKRPSGARAACLEQARQTRQADMRQAPAQVQAAKGMGSVTATTTTTVGDTSSTTVVTTPASAEPGR
jgi:hypothetical protein